MSEYPTAVVAGGCFWGVEQLFRGLPGVLDTEVGYTGGVNDDPTYAHHPGHAEAVCCTYDPAKISYAALLDFFFRIHDPTTKDRQGNDVGSSYRSAIFYANETERATAQAMIDRVNASGRWADPVVTTLEPRGTFYPAEAEHQDYLLRHPGGYTCHMVRTPSYLT